MKNTRIVYLTLCLAVSAAATSTQAQEKKLKREQLPVAVQKTVDAESHGATIKGLATEVEKGQRLYEAEMVIGGHSKDISMDKNGKIVEVEEEVAFDTLSQPVQDSLRSKAGKGTIGKIESLSKNGTLVSYEAHVTNGSRHFEIQVGPNGEKLSHPE